MSGKQSFRCRGGSEKEGAAGCDLQLPHACLGIVPGSPQRCPMKFMRRRRSGFRPKALISWPDYAGLPPCRPHRPQVESRCAPAWCLSTLMTRQFLRDFADGTFTNSRATRRTSQKPDIPALFCAVVGGMNSKLNCGLRLHARQVFAAARQSGCRIRARLNRIRPRVRRTCKIKGAPCGAPLLLSSRDVCARQPARKNQSE